jgi:hypothetical protein
MGPEYSDTFLRNLRTADEVVNSLKGLISAERLLELAEAGYAPSYRIDGGAVRFVLREIKDYVAESLVKKRGGLSFPEMLPVPVPIAQLAITRPTALIGIPHLQWLKASHPGVYFLVKAGEVVYVGQSINVYGRIGSHVDKDFDEVFWFPVPAGELNSVEAAFIRLLKPPLNGRSRSNQVITSNTDASADARILSDCGVSLEGLA